MPIKLQLFSLPKIIALHDARLQMQIVFYFKHNAVHFLINPHIIRYVQMKKASRLKLFISFSF